MKTASAISYAKVVQQILIAQSLSPFKQQVSLVAASKTKSKEEILQVYAEGHRDFGENYVDELIEKAAQLPEDVRWHFIGHLQSNKVSKLVKIPNLVCISSVDSLKLATSIDQHCSAMNRKIDILVQVKLSEEVSKSGIPPEELAELLNSISVLQNINTVGLMTIGAEGDVSVFTKLRQLRDTISDKLALSMGMSADFESAIQEGATIVRVGSSIFGPRNYTH